MLIDGLPPESRYNTALIDGMTDSDWENLPEPEGNGPWAREHHLLALIADRMAQNTHALLIVNGGKGKPPDPLKRPGPGASKRVDAARQELSAFYAQYLLDHQGEAPPADWDPYMDGGDLDG